MAQTLSLDNYGSLNTLLQTSLTADATAGSNVVLAVKNSANFSSGQHIAIGRPGTEQCEIQAITAITATSITVGTLSFAHYADEQITGLFGNQINIYSAANVNNDPPADNTFTKIGTVTILADWPSTEYTDNSGSSSFWYKFTYFDSTSLAETQIADSRAVRGGNYGNYASLAEIRAEAGMTSNPNISDSDIAKKRQRAQNIINGYLYGVYTTPFADPVPPLINTSCILLAAGYLLLEEYGQSATGMSKDGNAKIAQVIDPDGKSKSGEIGILDLIKMREIILTDDAGNSLLLSDLISSYPDDNTDPTTLTSDTNSIDVNGNQLGRYFSMRDRY